MKKGYQKANRKNKKGKGKAKKIFISFVMLSMFSTVAFGGSDAGVYLQNWYDKLFKHAASEIEDTYRQYLDTNLDIEDPESLQGDFDGITGKVNENSNSKVNEYATIAKNDLSEKEQEINGYMNKQFSDLVEEAKIVINSETQDKFDEKFGKLTQEGDNASLEAKQTIESELQLTNEQAKAELVAQIERIKADLQVNLTTNKDASIEELIKYIDTAIAKIQALIQESRQKLILEHESLLTAYALDLENEAKSELDQLLLEEIDN